MIYTPGQTTTALRAIVADRYSSEWDVREADSELARRELAIEAVYGDPIEGPVTQAEAELIEAQAGDLSEVEGADAATLRRNAAGRHPFEARVLARAAELLEERITISDELGLPLEAIAATPERARAREAAAGIRHPYGIGAAAPLVSELVPAPGGCVRCLTPEGPRNVHAGWCPDAEILRGAPAFDETDPATWSVPTGRGNECIENLPACYAWVPVVEAGVETGELHLIAPDGRNVSRAVAEAEVAAHAARRAALLAAEAADDELEDDEDGCEGHETLAGAHMGETVYCDGACVPRGRDAAPGLFG